MLTHVLYSFDFCHISCTHALPLWYINITLNQSAFRTLITYEPRVQHSYNLQTTWVALIYLTNYVFNTQLTYELQVCVYNYSFYLWICSTVSLLINYMPNTNITYEPRFQRSVYLHSYHVWTMCSTLSLLMNCVHNTHITYKPRVQRSIYLWTTCLTLVLLMNHVLNPHIDLKPSVLHSHKVQMYITSPAHV